MPKHRNLDPLDPFPADWTDAVQELISGLGAFAVRIKDVDSTVLRVNAGANNDQVGITIEGRWRYVAAPVERAGSGAARTVDVYVTAADNVFVAGSPGETDSTDYSFALAIVDTGAAAPATAIKRKVAVAGWDGSRFVALDPVIGGVADLGQRWRPGDMKASAKVSPEPGWLAANGAAVTVTYPALRATLLADGSPHGTDGSGNPLLPDMRGRMPMGAGTAAGAAGATAHALGQKGGEETHTLTQAEMPSHTHTTEHNPAVAHANDTGTGFPIGGVNSIASGSTGGDGPHNTLPPYQAVSWFVKT